MLISPILIINQAWAVHLLVTPRIGVASPLIAQDILLIPSAFSMPTGHSNAGDGGGGRPNHNWWMVIPPLLKKGDLTHPHVHSSWGFQSSPKMDGLFNGNSI